MRAGSKLSHLLPAEWLTRLGAEQVKLRGAQPIS
jgi:hypothetical protein